MTRILTYTATATDAPANMRFAAAMVPEGPGTHWVATGATEDEARGKLEAMLLPLAKRPKKAKPEPSRQAVGDII